MPAIARACLVGSPARLVVEHVTRLDDQLAPEWPSGNGSYRVVIKGSPAMRCEFEFEDEHGETRKLTRQEVLTYTAVIAGAGNETTGRLIGWLAKVLAERARLDQVAAGVKVPVQP